MLLCEWAITAERPADYLKTMVVCSVLSKHSSKVAGKVLTDTLTALTCPSGISQQQRIETCAAVYSEPIFRVLQSQRS